jgi:hypothetical protein
MIDTAAGVVAESERSIKIGREETAEEEVTR